MCLYLADHHSLSPPGQSGFSRSRGDKPQHAGADLAHIRRRSAADLHADAERLVPPLHKLDCIHGSAQEPGGASSPWAIDSPLPHTLAFQKWRMRPTRRSFVFPVGVLLFRERQTGKWTLLKTGLYPAVTAVYLPMISLPKSLEQTRTNARSSISYLFKNISIFLYIP